MCMTLARRACTRTGKREYKMFRAQNIYGGRGRWVTRERFNIYSAWSKSRARAAYTEKYICTKIFVLTFVNRSGWVSGWFFIFLKSDEATVLSSSDDVRRQ